MTIQETAKVVDIIKGAYPNWGATRETVVVWAQMFIDEPAEVVLAAVKSYIATDTKGFAPVVGQVKSIITKANSDDIGEGEAWALVRSAISNGIYGSVSEFEKLPPILKRVVGSPDQLEQWAMVTDGLDTVIQSNVKRAYRQELEKEQFNKSLPSDVRNVLIGVTQKQIGGM